MTFEVVIDNARMLANCFEEAPPEGPDVIIELPAYNVVDLGTEIPIGGGNILSVRDGSAIAARDQSFKWNCFGNGPGAPTSYDPMVYGLFPPAGAVPAGYVVGSVSCVCRGYVGADEAAEPYPYWANQFPYPQRAPFLRLDSSAGSGWFTIDQFPVGGYGADVVVPGLPLGPWMAFRGFYEWQTVGSEMFIDYIAARVTYTPGE